MPFFSVIVPVYNCEKYLKECVESVMTQSFTDWELLLIDDGSSDLSAQICESYAVADKRVKAVHKQNGGEFSARKTGLETASGTFITGLDADDYLEPDHLNDIYKAIENNNVDCVSFPVHYFEAREGITESMAPDGTVMDRDDYLLSCVRNSDFSFCNKAIRADHYKNTDYVDAPNIRFSEDMIMVIPALCSIERACVLNIGSYRYRIHEASSNARLSIKQIEYHDEAICYNMKKLKDAGVFSESLEREYIIFSLHSLNVRLWAMMVSGLWKKEMAGIVKNLSPFRFDINRDLLGAFDLKERIRINLIMKERYGIMGMLAFCYRLAGRKVEL